MQDDDVSEYVYLDSTIAENREKVLKSYITNKKESDELLFYDLDFYLNKNCFFQKIKNVFNKSVYDENISLLDSQIEILNILEENNLFLSAPTSFGKTFIVLEYIIRHQEKLNNIVFIVPTLALMNELLQKIYNKFSNVYNICINGNESIKDKNIFIFVPERSDSNFCELIKNIGLDLLIIDEIYKLKGDKKQIKSDDRIILMNKVYLDLINIAKKIVLLGPFIKEISFNNTNLNITKYYTNLLPVYNCVHPCYGDEWLNYMGGEKELIFFSSPQSIYKNIDKIINKFNENSYYVDKYKNEISYLENNIFDRWYAINLLKRGIGIHHGKTPLFLRKFYEDEFKNGELKCLLCTQTLMEGINTPTMRLLIVDNPGDKLSLNNLIGRVGRLNVKNPKSGDIYIFDKKACDLYQNRNEWEKIKILAEDDKIYSNDEILFLNKKCDDIKIEEDYEYKISKICEVSNKEKKELKKLDISINKAFNFINGKYDEKFLMSSSILDCIKYTCELFGKIGYLFEKKHFKSIKYPNDVLPSNYFISYFLKGNSISSIIKKFEEKYGKLSILNTNILIDKLFELRTRIKFKYSKILNYFELFNINSKDNNNLGEFISCMKKFNDLKINDKILEDLGIESKDYDKISCFMPVQNDISVSNVIKALKQNLNEINKLDISPFTKRCINKF